MKWLGSVRPGSISRRQETVEIIYGKQTPRRVNFKIVSARLETLLYPNCHRFPFSPKYRQNFINFSP